MTKQEIYNKRKERLIEIYKSVMSDERAKYWADRSARGMGVIDELKNLKTK